MAHLIGYVPLIGRLVGTRTTRFNLPPITTYDIDTLTSGPGRTLRHLTRANHSTYSPLFGNDFSQENGLGLLLVAAFQLGADSEGLHRLYEEGNAGLGEWVVAPREVIDSDWQDWYGEKVLLRSWVDLFEDAVVNNCGTHTWNEVMEEFLFQGSQPLFSGLIGSSGHPMIYLADAFEINSKEMTSEALALAAAQYSPLSKYLVAPQYTYASPRRSKSVVDLLVQMRSDERFQGVTTGSGGDDAFVGIFEMHEELMLEYWNAWVFEDPEMQFREAYELAVRLLATAGKKGEGQYEQTFARVLVSCHAVRRLLQFIPGERHLELVRAWWMLFLGVYVYAGRPEVGEGPEGSERKGRDWGYVENVGLDSEARRDVLFVQSLRAMRDVAQTWGDASEKVLASAVKLAQGFKSWK